MKTEAQKFDPSTMPPLKIVPAKNGWSLFVSSDNYRDGSCTSYPVYVFNSPTELANAVASLVQFGSIEKPLEEIVDVAQRFRKLIAEKSGEFFIRVHVENLQRQKRNYLVLKIYSDKSINTDDFSHCWPGVGSFFLDYRILAFSEA